MDKFRVAVATSEGRYVDTHFGRCETFYIYDVDEENIDLIDTRKVAPACYGGAHDLEIMKNNLKVLYDCQAILISRIGNVAQMVAETEGFEVFEIPGDVEESILEIIKFKKIKSLFG